MKDIIKNIKNIITNKSVNKSGVTFIELLVIISVLAILIAISGQVFVFFQKESSLNSTVEEIVSVLRLAQNKTLASEEADQYGVYFNTSVDPHEYVLFKGPDFVSRDVAYDRIYAVPKILELYDINLSGGNEAAFDRLTGLTSQPGQISLRLKSDPAKNKTIYIYGSGQVGLIPSSVPANSRIEDSRHVHFDYIRDIDTATENIDLFFPAAGLTYQIIIADNLRDGQIYWEGRIEVNGKFQNLKIQTHRLNEPLAGTQFSIHRDRMNNNEALIIKLSGDGSSIIEYSADGSITNYSSIYASNLDRQ
jgi:type II secretory pathway pseudopilin PulG